MTKTQQNCEHNWDWTNDDALEEAQGNDEKIGIPVICTQCEAKGVMWYKYADATMDE